MKTLKEYLSSAPYLIAGIGNAWDKEELEKLLHQILQDSKQHWIERSRLIAFNFDVEKYVDEHGIKYVGLAIADLIKNQMKEGNVP